MKKILSLIIAALFIVTMSANVFAAEVGTFTITISDAEVDAGTETVTLTFTVVADVENWGATNLTIPVAIPDGLTYVNDTLSSTLAGTSLTVGTAAVPASGLFSYDCEADDSDLVVDGYSTTFSATFAITDPSVAATYEISVLTSGDFDIADEENWDSYVNLYDTQFNTSDKGVITVKAAAQDETVTGTATTDAKRELLLGGTYYTNLAVFDAEIPLVSTKNAKEIGWTLSAPEKADKVIKYTPQTAISGQGSIVFAAIVYNVPADVTITATPYVVYGN